jgi:hypothetical protein
MTEIIETTEETDISELLADTTPPVGETHPDTEAPQEAVQPPVSEAQPVTTDTQQVAEADEIIAKLFARIAPPTEVKYRKLFLYGPYGCGKTVFCATAPRPLIVRVEPTGTLSLLNHPELAAKVQTFEFLSIEQVEILLNKIIEKPEAFDMFDTIVIDSFSDLQRIELDAVIAREAKKDSDRNKYTRTWPDYNESTIHMSQFAGLLTRLPKHVIATCHSKDKEIKGKGITITQPSVTDVLAEACAGFFDVMAYMSVTDEGTRTIRVSPTATTVAKTRVGGLPALLEEPTWDKLFGHLPGAN